MEDASALVLLSGGQDSTVCLAWALERYASVETIGFDYGQRHRIELDARQHVLAGIRQQFPTWGARLAADRVLHLGALASITNSALTRDVAIETTTVRLPSTFVPGRNLLFFTYAAAFAYPRDIATLVGGMCETDYAGYPDCRHGTLQALQKALCLGMAREFTIETPLMWTDKADTWKMAKETGGDAFIELIVEHTHTCYLGVRSRRHAWGYGCNHCPACDLRRKGWEAWQAGQS